MPALPTEYRLTLAKTGADLHATWITPAGVGTPFPIASPLSVEDAKEHRWYLEDPLHFRFAGSGDQARARAFEARLDRLGLALYHALCPPEVDHPVTALISRGSCPALRHTRAIRHCR